MRKIVLMALAAFLWKQVKARMSPAGATPIAGSPGPSETYGGRR